MRTFDFAPLHRATIGFDQIADMMDRVLTNDVAQPSYPPIQHRENRCRHLSDLGGCRRFFRSRSVGRSEGKRA